MSMGSKALKWDLLGVKINLPSIRKDEILAGERSPTRMMEILAWKFGENLFSLCSFKEQAGENARRSVSRVLFPPKRAMAIHLGRPSPDASRDPPGRRRGNPPAGLRPRAVPIRSCSRWGLPCRRRCRRRGALLPHPFTLTRQRRAVCSLWHFPWGRPRRALPGTVSPWSPDFPPPAGFPPLRKATIRPSGRA